MAQVFKRLLVVATMMMLVLLNLGGKMALAQEHHVVGGDLGWDPSTNIDSWSSGRTFIVGDKIWFTYSAAEGGIVELRSKEEYEACDVNNPIRMYTDGLNSISLDGEGIRYFASMNTVSCKNGLKVHVSVQPRDTLRTNRLEGSALATGPTPAGSGCMGTSLLLLVIGFFLYYYMGL